MVPFWSAIWCENLRIASSFPDLFNLSNLKDGLVINMGHWHNNVWTWDDFRISGYDLNYVRSRVANLMALVDGFYPNQAEKDEILWCNGDDAVYTTRAGYNRLKESINQEILELDQINAFRFLWGIQVPAKIKVFVWRLLLNRCAAKDQLKKRGNRNYKRVKVGTIWMSVVWCLWIVRNDIVFNDRQFRFE